jgi:hypothetical protein
MVLLWSQLVALRVARVEFCSNTAVTTCVLGHRPTFIDHRPEATQTGLAIPAA